MKRNISDSQYILAEFCSNFAVAWFVAGIITPFIAKTVAIDYQSIIKGSAWGTAFLLFAIYISKGGKV